MNKLPLIVTLCCVMGSFAVGAAEPMLAATQFADRVLRYPPGAPQLSYLNIEETVASPVPVLEPQNGRITYNDDLTTRVFTPVDGRVTRIVAKPGDSVRLGDPLAWLESPDYIQALADLNDARARLRQKTIERDRAAALYTGEVIARKDFEAAVFELEYAQEDRRRAEARFRHLNPTLDTRQTSFALRAPIDGVVTERKILPGTEVDNAKAEPLFVITDPTRLWVSFELAEKDVGKLHLGQPVAVSVEAYPDRIFTARIDFISDVVDPTTRRLVVRSELDNPERRLKPEMYAKVTPLAEGQSLPRVLNTALVTEGVKTFLFVEREPGVIEKREVRLAFHGPTTSWVKEGLKAGERIVTTGTLLLNAELSGQ
ncbi:MAG: efflux RND transporter periplasmic adaptor subunit [Gammaproteobacteria bacterium]|nr:efflux RND transporter periplasmic adaptor subunit [Gammaproteobacteria bacterium]